MKIVQKRSLRNNVSCVNNVINSKSIKFVYIFSINRWRFTTHPSKGKQFDFSFEILHVFDSFQSIL